MLGQRCRRCASIETTLAACDCPEHGQSVRDAYTTTQDVESMLVQRLSTIYDVGPTLSQL